MLLNDDDDYIGQYQTGRPTLARLSINIGEVWDLLCCHDNKMLSSHYGAHLVGSYCYKSNPNKLVDQISVLQFDQIVIELMTSLILANLEILIFQME